MLFSIYTFIQLQSCYDILLELILIILNTRPCMYRFYREVIESSGRRNSYIFEVDTYLVEISTLNRFCDISN